MSANTPDVLSGCEPREDPAAADEAPFDDSEEARAARELAEHNALADVFDDVRAQSADGQLVEPTRWAEIGLVPEHLVPDDFEMLVYEYLEEARGAAAAAAEAEEAGPAEAAPVYRSATRAVGVPPVIGPRAAAAAQDGAAEEASDAAAAPSASDAVSADSAPASDAPDVPPPDDDRSPFEGLSIPEGFELVELEGEWVLVPTDKEAAPVQKAIECSTVVALVGAHSYYLYDSSLMTDAFAHWAFLAAEDNDVITFVECVREDSRVYPRPMPAESLRNNPFKMTDQEIDRIWDTVRESGAYPDIQRTSASNGDVYYFSTDYLTPTYAASLAEWESVERYMNV